MRRRKKTTRKMKGGAWWDEKKGEGGWAREIGTICQLGGFTGKRCLSWSKKGHFPRVRTTFSMNVAQVLYFTASLFL